MHRVSAGAVRGNVVKILERDAGAGQAVVNAIAKRRVHIDTGGGDLAGIATVGKRLLGKVDTDLNSQIEIIMSDHQHQCYMSSSSQTDPPSVFF